MFKKTICWMVLSIFIYPQVCGAVAYNPEVTAKSAIVMDALTGLVMKKMPVSSAILLVRLK